MPTSQNLDSIPRGMTCRGVHRAVIEYLLKSGHDLSSSAMLDIPCGQGELISSLRRFFPGADLRGCDLKKPESLASGNFASVDASRPFTVFSGHKFDYIFSVSGVMEFDNTLQFFESCHQHLRDGGHFVVTNDNIVSMRDRISYFCLGKVRQYHLFVTLGQGGWKVIPIHNMLRILQDAGFRIREVRYVSLLPKDWLMLPFALLVYPFQFLYMNLSRSRIPWKEQRAIYPFRSLLCRHYIVVCQKDFI
ncbi:MAG: class I SAM-dependent methyltransferase [Polaromonas sp.]|uniref:class I SAM-dependent methyltransferase n=1 Tax=Polaromonas sp. TaxID=1869339 RepID=UPI00273267AC|nr:class I SAM-dependent methyltransferase [Polaromonas sp.]MDP2818892.1 class I SAM-dependent methyltransferase [Polaromonas sp.]